MEELIHFRCQQTLFEGDFLVFAKKTKQIKTIYIICIVFLALSVVSIFLSLFDSNFTGVPIFLIVLGIVYPIILPKTVAKQGFKEAAALNATTVFAGISNEVVFTENKIYDNSSNSSRSFDYRQITEIKETATHILLFITGNSAIIIRRDSFVYGDPAQLAGYIHQKKSQ